MAAGDRGLLSRPARSASVPGQHRRRRGLRRVRWAARCSTRCTATASGRVAAAQDDLAAGEPEAARRTRPAGIGATVVVEALNSHENPHYPLVTAAGAVGRRPGRPRPDRATLGFLADLYHLRRNGEDLARRHRRVRRPAFGHVQIADDPGRGAARHGRTAVPRRPPARRLGAAGLRGLRRPGVHGTDGARRGQLRLAPGSASRWEQPMTTCRLGFIGLGIMGSPMAANLVKAGSRGHRLRPERRSGSTQLAAAGGRGAGRRGRGGRATRT